MEDSFKESLGEFDENLKIMTIVKCKVSIVRINFILFPRISFSLYID